MKISSCQSTVLGKRKTRRVNENLLVRLTSPISTDGQLPEPSDSESLCLKPSASSIKVMDTKKRYRCTHHGCDKAYTKPSRLEEHERSHTGQRPFVCKTCGKSYLRDAHLHAHARSHLPDKMRPFTCDKDGCGKKFWTPQHLRVHLSWHDGAKPYQCQEAGCEEAFAKHHLLRAHLCAIHAPPGTKPYRCEHDGCSKSFNTNQHLRAHHKTHDTKRYTCSHPLCFAGPENSRRYFATWSSLQSHIRIDHPPTCPHPACRGKTFSNPGNLRTHLKLHEQRKAEADLQNETDTEAPVTKKRRGGEYGCDWKCQSNGCKKNYRSKMALQIHINVEHQGRQDFLCTHRDCTRSFGYKHLLQRHLAKVHSSEHSAEHASSIEEADTAEEERLGTEDDFDIDLITGNAYNKQADANLKAATVLRCPFPELDGLLDATEVEAQRTMPESSNTPQFCAYVFSRGYDLRRHLSGTHNVILSKGVVDRWVKWKKQSQEPSWRR